MANFHIDAANLHWLEGIDERHDHCLHGNAAARIGERTLTYDECTVSSTALDILRQEFDLPIIGVVVYFVTRTSIPLYTRQQSVLDNMKSAAPNLDETAARTVLGSFLFSGDDVYKPAEVLSGGEKTRLALATLVVSGANVLLLDEPTNNLDNRSVAWLEDFLMEFPGTLIVVSHDRWFLNNICTHIVDIDFNQVKLYVGNYDFWYESSQLIQSLIKNKNKRNAEKIEELQTFIARFAANKAKSKQATARRRLLDKLSIEEMQAVLQAL